MYEKSYKTYVSDVHLSCKLFQLGMDNLRCRSKKVYIRLLNSPKELILIQSLDWITC